MTQKYLCSYKNQNDVSDNNDDFSKATEIIDLYKLISIRIDKDSFDRNKKSNQKYRFEISIDNGDGNDGRKNYTNFAFCAQTEKECRAWIAQFERILTINNSSTNENKLVTKSGIKVVNTNANTNNNTDNIHSQQQQQEQSGSYGIEKKQMAGGGGNNENNSNSWDCTVCTFRNKFNDTTCDMCRQGKRPASKNPNGRDLVADPHRQIVQRIKNAVQVKSIFKQLKDCMIEIEIVHNCKSVMSELPKITQIYVSQVSEMYIKLVILLI